MSKTVGLKEWLEVEAEHFAKRRLSAHTNDMQLTAFMSSVRDGHAKAAEGLLFSHPVHPLIKLKVLLLRGRMTEASELVKNLKHELAEEKLDQTETVELLIEEVRFYMLQGEWLSCAEMINFVLVLDLPPLSRLELYQMRALCFFESGDFQKALLDIERTESIGTEFPTSQALFYSKVLRYKILIRGERFEAGFKLLEREWQSQLSKKSLNLDIAVTLLRLEIDLNRLSLRPHLDLSLASYFIFESTGDKLYAALALTDCFFSATPEFRQNFENQILKMRTEFQRVNNLLTAIEENKTSTTVGSIINFSLNALNQEKENYTQDILLSSPRFVLLESRQLLLHLDPWKIVDLTNQKQISDALIALSSRPISKTAFFGQVWGKQKYVPHLHDSLIRSLLHRIRKSCQVEIGIEDSTIFAHDIFVVKSL